MAQQTLNRPAYSHMPPNTGDGAEYGDPWDAVLAKVNAMTTELYAKAAAAVAAAAIFTKYSTNAASGAATAAAGDLTGAPSVTCNYSAVGAANLTTRTAAQMFADAAAVVGQTYEVEIMNSAGSGSITLVGGTGVTINGTATILFNTARWYAVTFVSATTMTFQNLGSGSI